MCFWTNWARRIMGLPLPADGADADEFPEADQWPDLLKLQANFENREAIYIEKGATRVCVNNIRGLASCAAVRADIEELPAPGLGIGIFDTGGEKPTPY